MKKLILVISGLSLALLGYFSYPFILSALFKVSGEVTIAQRLSRRAAKPNSVCFIVAKNSGGVPVAIKKYLNPKFPLKFNITKKDLIIADAWKDNIQLEAFINQHGEVGSLKAGDMFTEPHENVKMFDDNITLNVDKMMGVPRLRAGARYTDKSYWMFRSAAR